MQNEEFEPHLYLADMGLICLRDSEAWFPETAYSLTHHLIALGGEVGELMNVYKKIERGSLPDIKIDPDNESRQQLLEELTDVLIYAFNIAGLLQGNVELMFETKRWENEQRFGHVDD